MIWELDGHRPQIAADAWIAPDAQIIGKVVIEEGASIWWGAVLRGDNEVIHVGRGSNVQENCVFHTDMGCPLTVGADVTIGHKALLHGCIIGDGALVGMNATVLNRTVIGAGTLIGAGALVAEDKDIPAGSLVVGMPGRVVRELRPDEQARIIEMSRRYTANARRYREGLRRID